MASIVKSLNPLAQASAVGVTFKQLNLEQAPAQRPEVIAVLGSYATGKTITDYAPILSDGTVDQAFALYGPSPLYFAASKLFPANGNGAKVPVFFVPCPDGATAATGDITFSGTTTKTVVARATFREINFASAADAVGKIATNAQLNPARSARGIGLDGFNTFGVRFVIPKGTAAVNIPALLADAIAEEPTFPFTVVDSGLSVAGYTSKWKGTSANMEIDVVLDDGSPLLTSEVGIAAAVTQPTGGAEATSVQTALDNLTEAYRITRIVNQYDDDTNLDLIQAWGEAKRSALVGQYAISYFGREYDESGVIAGTVDIAAIKAFGDARRLDAVNSVIYGTFGDLREVEYDPRDTLLKAGVTNIQLKAGVPTLMDVVTFYHPSGVANPIFTYDDSITKEGNIAFDLLTFFDQEDWKNKILVSTSSKTTNPDALDVNGFAAAVYGRAELWEKTALIASADFVKENSAFAIDDINPRRINSNVSTQLTSTLSVIDNTLRLGFLFGEEA